MSPWTSTSAAAATALRRKVWMHSAAIVLVPTIPVAAWWYWARDDRAKHSELIRTKVRVPNVATMDDLLLEQCRPGDVWIFDRRCEKCAAGPLAASSCLLGRAILCKDQDTSTEVGTFDHCGIVVPGYIVHPKDKYDASNLLLLEATSGSGIVARPLLQRLEMSQSRTVMVLPLQVPGTAPRNATNDTEDENPQYSEKTCRLLDSIDERLAQFRDAWIANAEKQNYASAHSTLSILGSLAYALKLTHVSRGPTCPSAWVVVSALQAAGVGEHVNERQAMEAKVHDFLRDFRFHDVDTVRLRPGFKYMAPVPLQEMSRS